MPRAIDTEVLESPNMQILDLNNPPTKVIPYAAFPKMVYLHPKDKTKEHRTRVVQDIAELTAAESQGWRQTPHIPVEPVEDLSQEFEAERPVATLEAMTKAELVAFAKEHGVSIDVAEKKEVILAAIQASQLKAA